MKPTAAELAPIAVRAKAMPNAVEGVAYVAVGNSVPPEVGQMMAEALKNAGFKDVKVDLGRRP